MLVLGLERAADDAGRGVVHHDVPRSCARELVHDARRRNVATHEHGLGARVSQFARGLLRGGVVAEIPIATRAAPSRAKRSAIALPNPPLAPGTETAAPSKGPHPEAGT